MGRMGEGEERMGRHGDAEMVRKKNDGENGRQLGTQHGSVRHHRLNVEV